MQITRRDFLEILVLAPVVGITVSHAGNKGRLTVYSLNITVPTWLFEEKSKDKARVRALAIEENKEAMEVVVLFDGNRQLTLNPNTSVQWLIQKNANRPTRESMLLKRVISYSLDSIFSSLRDKRHPEIGASLRQQFDALQAEEVIEVVSVGAMYDLLSKLNDLPVISSVSWDSTRQRFIVF